MSRGTTTSSIFRVEDITFKGARRQSDIESEIEIDDTIEEKEVTAPVSLTPEQVKAFYLQKLKNSDDSNLKRVYAQTIKWIDELQLAKAQLILYRAKEERENAGADTPDDIQELQQSE